MESRENTAVRTAIVCLAVCGVMGKASVCGRSVHDIISQSFLLFMGEEETNMAVS